MAKGSKKTKKKKVIKKKSKGKASKKKMAHVDKEIDIDSIIGDLSKDFEVEIMAENSIDRTPHYIKCSNIGLNMITGGVPGGRMVEVRAKSQAGKSYLLYEWGIEAINMGGAFLLHDVERAYEPAYGRRVGLSGNKKFALSEEKGLEKIFDLSRRFVMKIREVNKKCPILIGVDSYPPIQTMLTQKEIEEQLKKGAKELKGYREAKKNALFSNLLGEFVTFMADNDATFVLLNQLKHKMNVMFGDDKTSNADNIVQFYVSLRLQGTIIQKLTKEITIPGKKHKKKKKIGVRTEWETIKNRNIPPFKTTVTDIIYKTGINKFSGVADLLIEEGVKLKKKPKQKGKPQIVVYKGKEYTLERLYEKKPKLFLPLKS